VVAFGLGVMRGISFWVLSYRSKSARFMRQRARALMMMPRGARAIPFHLIWFEPEEDPSRSSLQFRRPFRQLPLFSIHIPGDPGVDRRKSKYTYADRYIRGHGQAYRPSTL
jgi:hypothetical protein